MNKYCFGKPLKTKISNESEMYLWTFAGIASLWITFMIFKYFGVIGAAIFTRALLISFRTDIRGWDNVVRNRAPIVLGIIGSIAAIFIY